MREQMVIMLVQMLEDKEWKRCSNEIYDDYFIEALHDIRLTSKMVDCMRQHKNLNRLEFYAACLYKSDHPSGRRSTEHRTNWRNNQGTVLRVLAESQP